ncbi:thioesterase family protein [Castellaniella sp.]|uniref:acyl-CoA thioesterase n=1 Tax=Castellaniella sp. TaxID=1955812 RepID=UPI002AFF4024|nr:thioesterase family protein [Castellaniella sp.]
MSSETVDIQTTSGTFEIVLPVRWGDMDALSHVNNAAYFRYFEEARVRLVMALGLGPGHDRNWLLAHASCDFLKPLLYPADIVVGFKLLRVGRSSIEFDCWIADAQDTQILHARGRNILVCADGATGRSVPWTDADRQVLSRYFSV